MASTYSARYRLELIATGEKINTWGPIVNSNLGTLLEDAIDGYITIAMSDANLTLSVADGASDQARNRSFRFTGTLTTAREVIVPSVARTCMFWNATTQSLTIKTASGTGLSCPSGARLLAFCDGTNVLDAAPFARLTGGSIAGMSSIAATDVLRGAVNLADFPITSVTGNYTLVDTDRHKMLYRTGATAAAITIPANATLALPIGTFIRVAVADGATLATVVPAAGVTLRTAGTATAGTVTLTARQIVSIVKVATDEWFLIPTAAGAGSGALLAANNLSDLASAGTARTNLGLGTAATQATGTTGATVPLLNAANPHTDARGVAAAATDNLQLGFRRLRPASVTTGTVAAADSDSCVYATGGVTVPADVFVQGDCFLIYNNSGSAVTITQGSGLTLRLDGTATTGNRTLAARGRAAVQFISATEAVIGGALT